MDDFATARAATCQWFLCCTTHRIHARAGFGGDVGRVCFLARWHLLVSLNNIHHFEVLDHIHHALLRWPVPVIQTVSSISLMQVIGATCQELRGWRGSNGLNPLQSYRQQQELSKICTSNSFLSNALKIFMATRRWSRSRSRHVTIAHVFCGVHASPCPLEKDCIRTSTYLALIWKYLLCSGVVLLPNLPTILNRFTLEPTVFGDFFNAATNLCAFVGAFGGGNSRTEPTHSTL